MKKEKKEKSESQITKKETREMKLVKDLIDEVDLVIELTDARFFFDSRLYELENYIKEKGKFLLIIVNKTDLISKEDYIGLKKEIKSISQKERTFFDFVSVRERKGISKLRKIVKKIAKIIEAKEEEKEKKFEKEKNGEEEKEVKSKEEEIKKEKETKERKIKCCVIGLPNTGKSSVINGLKGKYAARTSIKPGFTRGYQYIRLSKKILLVDTPGVYIPNLPKEHLVFLNAIDLDKIEDAETSAYFIYDILIKKDKKIIEDCYGFDGNFEEFFRKFAIKNNFLLKKGEIDWNRAYKKFLQDWYNGEIKVCFHKSILEEMKKKDKKEEIKDKSKKRLVFDTNFLIYYAKEGNIEDIELLIKEYSCIIIDKTFEEIEKLLIGKYKYRVKLLLEFLENKIREKSLAIVNAEKDVDSTILKIASEGKIDAVATYDKDLIKKIKKINPMIKIVY